MRKIYQTGVLGAALSLLLCTVAAAQSIITPDNTLGDETSVIEAFDADIDLITGGATREKNLFHSFEVFGIGAARAAYFITESETITNIFARITGDSISEIQGFLGTRQRSNDNFFLTSADLFLINPNGVVFSGNAALDIGGSLTVTTASGVQFGDSGSLNAVNPEVVSSRLTVDPSTYLFEPGVLGRIESRLAPSSNGDFPAGLFVPNGETISFLAEDIALSGSGLYAPGGQIVLQAESLLVTDQSQIDVGVGGRIDIEVGSFDISDNSFLLAGLNRLPTNAPIDTERGRISIVAQSVRASDNSIIGSFVDPENSTFSDGADILIFANSLIFSDGSRIVSQSLGSGASGNISVFVSDEAIFEGSRIQGSEIFSSGIFSDGLGLGNGGNIEVQAGNLSVIDGAVISAATQGRGNAGNVNLTVAERARFDGTSVANTAEFVLTGGAFSIVFPGSTGNGGNLSLTAGGLEIANGAVLSASTAGEGNAGNISIQVQDSTLLIGADEATGSSGIRSAVEPGGVGNGGSISLSTRTLDAVDGAQITAGTFGTGDAGDVIVEVNQTARFAGVGADEFSTSGAFSSVGAEGLGSGGNLLLLANGLEVTDGAQLSAASFGEGNAGNVTLGIAEVARFEGSAFEGSVSSGASSSVDFIGTGDGGDLSVFANRLELIDGAQLSAANMGFGDAGSVSLLVADRLMSRDGTISTEALFGSGGSVDIVSQSILLSGDSNITTAVERGTVQNSGSISIDGIFLIALDDSDFIAFNADGRGGNINFNDTVVFIDADQASVGAANFETFETVDGNNRVDIAASGQSFATTVGSTVESASYLPTGNPLVTGNIVARSCIDQRDLAEGSFVVTGDAGVPQQPGGALSSSYETGTVRTALESDLENSFQEPENVYQLADGRLILSRSCER